MRISKVGNQVKVFIFDGQTEDVGVNVLLEVKTLRRARNNAR